MAKSESQALQIAVIIFAILTIFLSISTYYFYSEASKAEDARAEAEKTAQDQRNAFNAQFAENQQLKTMIVNNAEATLDDVQQQHDAVLARAHDNSLPAEVVDQVNAITSLLQTLSQRNQELAAERDRLNQIDAKYATLEADNNKRLMDTQNQFAQQRQDLMTQVASIMEQQQNLADQVNKISTQLREQSDIAADAKKELVAATTKAQAEVQKVMAQNNQLSTQIQGLTNETFEVADGEIRFVNQRTGTAWVNIGRADGLREQTTFSVFGREANDVARTDRKGVVEVTQVLDAHLSEVRILEDVLADPILPGDKIYTPLWHPGRHERFAVAGDFDIDGDGLPDHEAVLDLIRMSGGKVDAHLTSAGEVQGEISLNTRYLLLGDVANEHADKLSKMRDDARSWGVETMTFDKFKDHIGFTGLSKAVHFGAKSNPADFNDVRLPNEQSPIKDPNEEALRDRFRQRRPPRAPKGGAY